MISLTADDNRLLKDLRRFIEPVEVYDSAGKLLGLFVPANLERGKELHAQLAARIDRAEIERRMRSQEPGIPSEDVLDRLKLLQAESQRRKAASEPDFTPEEAVAFIRSLREQRTHNG